MTETTTWRCSNGHEVRIGESPFGFQKTANFCFGDSKPICAQCLVEWINALGLPAMELVPDEPKPDVEFQ